MEKAGEEDEVGGIVRALVRGPIIWLVKVIAF